MRTHNEDSIPLSDPEPSEDQLPVEDTLVNTELEDQLDEGYSPNDYPRAGLYDDTPADQAQGLTISEALAEEEPEVWDDPESAAPTDERAGRLVDDPEAADGRENDVFAVDEGIDGGAASAEEAAVHIRED